MDVIYEDNHLIVVNKAPGEIVQGDKTGDEPLSETLKRWIKEKYAKPGNVFCGVTHRLDRPVGGLVIFAKTSKALSRMNELFRNNDVRKTYWAITKDMPPKEEDTLVHYITTVERNNKSYAHTKEVQGSQKAILKYKVIGRSDNYNLLEIELITGRKHQIRVQLSAIGCPIKGDLKYGAKRSNPDGSISLLARSVEFIHPVSKKHLKLFAPIPNDNLWKAISPDCDDSVNESLDDENNLSNFETE